MTVHRQKVSIEAGGDRTRRGALRESAAASDEELEARSSGKLLPMTQNYEYPRAVFSRMPGLQNSPPEICDAYLEVIDTVFFASMMAEEGEFVPIGVVVELDEPLEEVRDTGPAHDQYSDNKAWFVWRIDAIPFDPHRLKKLAHGTEYGRELVIVTRQNSALVMTGIARRRFVTDGGRVVRVAAPRPGVLVLEGRNRQFGVRYEAGVGRPNDVEIFEQEGPVLEALRMCHLERHCWRLEELLRHARASKSGAMFLCLPTVGASEPHGKMGYRFVDSSTLERLAAEERALLFEGLASAHVDGRLEAKDVAEHAAREVDRETNRSNILATIEMIGRLAANDGAVVIEPGFRLLGAGFIIADMKGKGAERAHPEPRQYEDAAGRIVGKEPRSGGARHAAGYRFAWAVEGAVVFIVSADGPVTCTLRRGEDLLAWSVRLPET